MACVMRYAMLVMGEYALACIVVWDTSSAVFSAMSSCSASILVGLALLVLLNKLALVCSINRSYDDVLSLIISNTFSY